MMKKRYFKNKRAVFRAKDSLRVDLGGQLSPYDALVKKYANQYGQDWRLITAQIVPGIQIRSQSRQLGRRAGPDAGDAEDGAAVGICQSPGSA